MLAGARVLPLGHNGSHDPQASIRVLKKREH
jgi:hypothetical protein